MKPLPIGIQTFDKIINKDMVYVDKTELIYESKYISEWLNEIMLY